jgi:hypothetical protein
MPRFVFLVSGDGTFYVRPDTLQLEGHMDLQSFQSGIATTTCTNHPFTSPIFVLPLAGATPASALTLPTMSFVGPLHLSPS